MIRPATLADAVAIAALEERLFGADAWSHRQVVAELDGPGRRAWVSVDPSAYLITMTNAEISDLQRIGVAPDAQRRGVARALLDLATAAARADGAERMLLEVRADNHAALGFYRATGFVEIDRRPRYYRDGTEALVLSRSLTGRAAPSRSTAASPGEE